MNEIYQFRAGRKAVNFREQVYPGKVIS